MHRQRFLFPALAALTMLRLAMLPVQELAPDEALAWVAARQSGWNWIEQGPLLACMVKVSAWVFGPAEFGVRFFAPWLAAAASLCVWLLARGCFDERTASWSVVILNVMPAFNLAAITMAPATIEFAATAALLLCVRVGLHRANPRHPAWCGAAGAMMALVWADAHNLIALPALALGLWVSGRWRRQVLRPGFWIVCGGWLIAAATWAMWNLMRGWPSMRSPFLPPDWRLVPNALRWLLLVSPALLLLMLGAMARIWKAKPAPARIEGVLDRERQNSAVSQMIERWIMRPLNFASIKPHHGLLLGFAVPLMVVDFGWGSWERWPGAGLLSWIVPAAVLLAFAGQQSQLMPTSAKIQWRFAVLSAAAVQSALLMNTDIVRYARVSWPFAMEQHERHTWSRLFAADPASAMRGWREAARIVREIEADGGGSSEPWFVVADDWKLAACLSYYLEGEAPLRRPFPNHPAAHALQNGKAPHPFAFWPRYDRPDVSGRNYRDLNAFFVTDDPQVKSPPAELAGRFEKFQVLTIADVMHGGQKVRTLKIFACHGYRSPD